MPQQDDLFPVPPLSVEVPKGLTEPRLWVRRLKIWKEPGGEVIRDIKLRPGLNIIWSPDGDDDPDAGGRAIGHGSGKTLFCRLLRYCLGEVRFADEVQRDAISKQFLNGVVGAEVILDGVCWAVARPLGTGRKHFAVEDGTLDEVAKMEGTSTGMEPLVDVIESQIIGEGTARLASLPEGQHTWPVALAWASRDQECRFNDVLDWRSSASGSDSPQPASGDAKGPRLLAMRAFLNAITENEQKIRIKEQRLVSEIEDARRQKAYLEWDQNRRLKRLVRDLGLDSASLPDMPLLLDHLKSVAEERLSAEEKLPSGDRSELVEARKAAAAARDASGDLKAKAAELAAVLPIHEALLRRLESEVPGLSAAALSAASPVCPICEVPIDTALAEGCRLSHQLPDQAQCRARLESKREEIDEQKEVVAKTKTEIEALKPRAALAHQNVQQAEERVKRIEAASDSRDKRWRAATRNVEDIQRADELIDEIFGTGESLKGLETDLHRARDQLRGLEDKQAKAIGSVSQKFSAIIQRLLGEKAKGTVRLTGKGLEVTVEAGGDRRTAAIQSLKVLAFDLACLVLSIEGLTRIPAFLIHDSPREADLGQTIYDAHFRLLRELEEKLSGGTFQYVITTTTRPPQDVNEAPWRRQVLRGAPGRERLLGCDLLGG